MQNNHQPQSTLENPTRKVASSALLVTALTLTLLMLIQSGIRRLNFDEWLVLRTGWLMASHEPSNLHFLMPWTWLVGQLSILVQSVPALTLALRLTTALAVLTTLWWALRAQQKCRYAALQAYVLTLSCGAFIGHGIEIRYDAVILWSWLAAWGLLARPTPGRMVALGALITVLLLHQTKGVFFAMSLLCCAWLSTRTSPHPMRRHLVIGALIPGAVWFGALVAQGLLTEQIAIYDQFARIRTEHGNPMWADLMAQLSNDWAWWLLVATPAVLVLLKKHRSPTTHVTLILGLTPVAFIALHPHPWPYMLTPCVPFFASLCTNALDSISPQQTKARSWLVCVLTGCLGLALLSAQKHLHALQADGRSDLQALEVLRAAQVPQDQVLDPSGAAYFIRPMAPDWYLDGLFRHRLAHGTWHPAPSGSSPLPSIVVRSYRLDWIVSFPASEISRHYEQACHWIWIRKGDPRAQLMRNKCPSEGEESLLNYWQILP